MKKIPTIEAVVLDLGGVVLEIDGARTLSALELPPLEKGFGGKLASWPIYDAFERGTLATPDFVAAAKEWLGGQWDHATFLSAWNQMILGPLAGVEHLLAEAAQKTHLSALSNTNPLHVDHLKSGFPVMDIFHRVFTSCDLGRRKPEKEIYLEVAAALKKKPVEILFVDDLAANVEGARDAGLNAELCRNSAGRLREILRRYRIL
jgi:putative hydrolase of the HAD superfamily